jgi:putative transposase
MTIDGGHQRGRHVVSALHTHVVVVTTYRRSMPTADMLRHCKDATRKICGDAGARQREVNGEDGHMHLLSAYPPEAAVLAW